MRNRKHNFHLMASISVGDLKAPKGDLSHMTVGNRILAIRKEAGLSQAEFAKQLGVSRGAVGNWEHDKGIKTENLLSIADRFGRSLDWLSGNSPDGRADTSPELPSTDELSQYVGIDSEAAGRRVALIEQAYDIDLQSFLRVDDDEWASIVGGTDGISDIAANRIAIATGLPATYVLAGSPEVLTRVLISAKRGRRSA
ncbi:helix-turn-helix transcriptional regulator [Ancylobacter sonchi]|uniref:helix-turn-helix transcriptional regulator n=1 Tax=Ancylobacter sonchi TaxID=1937790 RepID=UPI001BD2A06D|nr:helix-turn-helix transcriptional regulator [Ancylobacter sonchi]MBS7532095.1 helix-turn-helix transcriptional regulator [Ancylobacter sonchi]